MIAIRLLAVLSLATVLAGCAGGAASPPSRGSQSPRTRCLSDPDERGSRPLFFLFCIESP